PTVAFKIKINISVKIFLAIVLSGNININNDARGDKAFANGTTDDRVPFITNVINFGLDG
ncbi:19765_t:CDS:2, partial [Dentiscutata erythropus]